MSNTILNLCSLSPHPEKKTEREEGGAYFNFIRRGRLFEDLQYMQCIILHVFNIGDQLKEFNKRMWLVSKETVVLCGIDRQVL